MARSDHIHPERPQPTQISDFLNELESRIGWNGIFLKFYVSEHALDTVSVQLHETFCYKLLLMTGIAWIRDILAILDHWTFELGLKRDWK